MVTEAIKRTALKKILGSLVNLSDENLIRIINFTEKVLIRDEGAKKQAEGIKKAFKENHYSVQLVRDTFQRLSKKCRDKFIENFFINEGILGANKRVKMAKKLGFGIPGLMVISPTAKCNLRCIGCYAGEYQKMEDLSFELVDRILTEAKELGIYFVVISGGEPFMWPPLLKIYEKHNDIFFLNYTNGTLIDKEMAKKLSELGNVTPAISIEGFQKETDGRRGTGVFDKVLKAMDNLKEAGVLFGYSVTPTKNNSEILSSDEFVDLMISKGASYGWYFQYVPVGLNPDTSLMSTPEQRNALRLRIAKIRETKPIFIGDFWNDGHFVGGCMAGGRSGGYFHINCRGDVEPCVFLQFHVDNIKDKKLVEVINSPFFKAIRKEQPYCDDGNLLTPCALIDNPKALRDAVKKFGAKPSYNSSMCTVEDPKITKFLDEYSKKIHEITGPVWEKELKGKWKHWKEKKGNEDLDKKE